VESLADLRRLGSREPIDDLVGREVAEDRLDHVVASRVRETAAVVAAIAFEQAGNAAVGLADRVLREEIGQMENVIRIALEERVDILHFIPFRRPELLLAWRLACRSGAATAGGRPASR